MFDTRIYHSFVDPVPVVLREVSGWEAPYLTVRRVRSSTTQLHCLSLISVSLLFIDAAFERRLDSFDRSQFHLGDFDQYS